MNKTLEYALKHLNPLRDFEDIKLEGMHGAKSSAEIWHNFYQRVKNLAHVVKPFTRGSVVGGAVGAVASYMAGGSPSEGYVRGAVVGIAVDVDQWLIRYAIREVAADFRHINKEKDSSSN